MMILRSSIGKVKNNLQKCMEKIAKDVRNLQVDPIVHHNYHNRPRIDAIVGNNEAKNNVAVVAFAGLPMPSFSKFLLEYKYRDVGSNSEAVDELLNNTKNKTPDRTSLGVMGHLIG